MAAFIGEPIQGAGGVIVPPATYWPEIQRICDKYGILLVSDEVISGFGRTGHWFGCETLGFKPDLMTFAKGVTSGYIPLGGVMVGERVAQGADRPGRRVQPRLHLLGPPGGLRGGAGQHPADPARRPGRAGARRRRARTSPSASPSWREHPLVGEAQTCGLMGALQIVKDKATGATFDAALEVGMVCRGHCFGNGLIMRAVGDRMIIAPPLVITRAQIDEMVALIRKCLDLTLADAAAARLALIASMSGTGFACSAATAAAG